MFASIFRACLKAAYEIISQLEFPKVTQRERYCILRKTIGLSTCALFVTSLIIRKASL